MLYRYLFLGLLCVLVSSINAREYLVSQALPVNGIDPAPKQITLTLYANAKDGEPLEVHALPANQWRLQGETEDVVLLQANLDTYLSQPLWAEVSLDGQPMSQRSQLRALGDLTTRGEIHSLAGFRFPDDSLQTSAANTEALDNVLGGGSNCPAGSSIRVIDGHGNVTCETDDVGSGTVTQINSGGGLTGGSITTTGTISVAPSGIVSSMIQDGTIGSADIDTSQVQRRVSGSCPQSYMLTGINADGSLQCISLYDLVSLPPRILTVDSSGTVGQYNALVLDASGHPVISYRDDTNGDLKVIKCNDPACSGDDEAISTVDSIGSRGLYTSIVLDTSGYPVISYYDASFGNLRVAHCNDTACSGNDEAINIVDSAGDVGRHTSIALDASGNPIISYYDVTSGNLKVAHCNDPACAGDNETITTVQDTGDVGLYTSLILNASGNPVISYYDLTNTALSLVRCMNPACTSFQVFPAYWVDTTGDVGRYNSLVLDVSGNPVISYYDATDDDLKLVHCNDPACSGLDEVPITVDSTGNVGLFTSLALDASGFPVISYFDLSNGDLKVVHCNDPACTGGNEVIITVDSSLEVGTFTSLVLDTSGHPVISYFDVSNSDLKVVKCGTPSCR